MKNTRLHIVMLIAFLTAIAYVLADTVDALVSRSLEASSLTASLPGGQYPPVQAMRELANYTTVLDRGMFGDGAMPSRDDRSSAGASYRLIGTVEGAAFAGAVIEEGKVQTFYRVNQKLPDGSMIVKVVRRKISLRRPDGALVDIEVVDDAPLVAVTGNTTSTVRQLASNKYVVDQREVLSSTENLSAILTQARAVPYIEHGKTTGFRISDIVANSVFTRIGLRNGDIIQRINSQELDNPAKFFQLYEGLRNERSISIDIVRNGRRETLNYEIR